MVSVVQPSEYNTVLKYYCLSEISFHTHKFTASYLKGHDSSSKCQTKVKRSFAMTIGWRSKCKYFKNILKEMIRPLWTRLETVWIIAAIIPHSQSPYKLTYSFVYGLYILCIICLCLSMTDSSGENQKFRKTKKDFVRKTGAESYWTANQARKRAERNKQTAQRDCSKTCGKLQYHKYW